MRVQHGAGGRSGCPRLTARTARGGWPRLKRLSAGGRLRSKVCVSLLSAVRGPTRGQAVCTLLSPLLDAASRWRRKQGGQPAGRSISVDSYHGPSLARRHAIHMPTYMGLEANKPPARYMYAHGYHILVLAAGDRHRPEEKREEGKKKRRCGRGDAQPPGKSGGGGCPSPLAMPARCLVPGQSSLSAVYIV